MKQPTNKKVKIIAIYSGKGGVGKTTISALLALAISKHKKTAIVDFDINTPSLPRMFGNKKELKNLSVASTGFGEKVTLGYTGKTSGKVLKALMEEAMEHKPEVIIVDLPPSTNEIHMAMCNEIKPSAFILVTQANSLSEDDALRATALFLSTDIPIVGVIHNMIGEIFGTPKESRLKLPILATLDLNKEIAVAGQTGKMATIKTNPLLELGKTITSKMKSVHLGFENAIDWGGLSEEEMKKITVPKHMLKYIGTNSWDFIRHEIIDHQSNMVQVDAFLDYCNSKDIKRMLDNLDDKQEGFFRIIRPPHTKITLFAGEIGIGILSNSTKYYYGVPRIEYETDKEKITLFPHEISPVSAKEYMKYKEDKEYGIATKSTTLRLIPQKNVFKEIQNAFGLNAENWEKEYDKLGVI